MKGLATNGVYTVCLVLLGMCNVLLFIYMMLMMGFVGSYQSFQLLMPLILAGFLFCYYLALPVSILGFLCSTAFSMAKQTDRAQLLAALSGGALFSAIMMWLVFRI